MEDKNLEFISHALEIGLGMITARTIFRSGGSKVNVAAFPTDPPNFFVFFEDGARFQFLEEFGEHFFMVFLGFGNAANLDSHLR